LLLGLIIAGYLVVGVLYAVLTPTWQVPDEPAHFNYIRSLAEGRGLPVLEPGDYDQALLGELTSRRFPPELSVAPVEYEDHQPPLYYLLAAPFYLAFDGGIVPLRLFSVLLGAALLVVAFIVVRAMFPTRTGLALTVCAFIAFIPQHVAMSAGVNNDILGELVLAATLWALVGYVNGRRERPWLVGLLLGAALLTKTTAYIAFGAAGIAVVLRHRMERRTLRWAAIELAYLAIPALVLSAPWFIRNGLTYGWDDPLGLVRHEQVVAGQPRSSEWLATYGWVGLGRQLIQTTFRSFWGQFGWMGVVLPVYIYQALALLSILLTGGFLLWVVDRRRSCLSSTQRTGLAVLAASALLTALAFLWYNLAFVQHQGRYLYPALIPIGIAAMLGLGRLVAPVPERMRPWAMGLLFAAMFLLDLVCLFGFIIPMLSR
jgi:4-amino-4-deoxy-L-arabinose transferase-like glycosyltransferase